MIKTERQGLLQLLKIATPYMMITTVYAIVVLGLEEYFGDHIYKISGQIGSVFGLAVAFFLGFRMNSAYDRWWEARKIFGELTNNTRSFTAFDDITSRRNIEKIKPLAMPICASADYL